MPEPVRESLKTYLEEALGAVAARRPTACSVLYEGDPATSTVLRVTLTLEDGGPLVRVEPMESLATRLIEATRFFA